jgi:predicted DNA binding CopG/RHH family protein
MKSDREVKRMDTKRDIRDHEELKLRSVPVRISDKDLRALAEKCGGSGITIQELFELLWEI